MHTLTAPIIGKYIAFLLTLLCVGGIFMESFSLSQKHFPEGAGHIAFVLDVSQSMLVQDVDESSRLLAAKQYIAKTMSQNPSFDFSLTIFAGASLRILPFTSDISLFQTFLQTIDHSNVTKQGTRIDLALEDALAGFGTEKTGTIILITDGDEESIKLPASLQAEMAAQDVKIVIVGVGTKQGGYIPEAGLFSNYKTYQGKPVIARLNQSGLQDLAKTLSAEYVSLGEDIKLDGASLENNTQDISVFLIFGVIFWLCFLFIHLLELYFPHLLLGKKI